MVGNVGAQEPKSNRRGQPRPCLSSAEDGDEAGDDASDEEAGDEGDEGEEAGDEGEEAGDAMKATKAKKPARKPILETEVTKAVEC